MGSTGPLGILVLSFASSLLLAILIHRIGLRLGIVGRDVHKGWESYAVRIGGVSLIAPPMAVAALHSSAPAAAFLAVSLVALLLGLIDDLVTLPAARKVVLSVLPGLVHLAAGTYDPRLYIPMLGEISARALYIFLIPAAYAVALNAANMSDTHNGLLAGSLLIAFSALCPVMVSRAPAPEDAGAMAAASIGGLAGLLVLNAYPARVFVGNAGSFIAGSWIAFLSIYTRSEFLFVLTLFPMVINGFSIITSVGGLKEKGDIRVRPVEVREGVIRANKDPRAPITLAHIASIGRGLRELELVVSLWILVFISSTAALALWRLLAP